jgi:hypothetical protein
LPPHAGQNFGGALRAEFRAVRFNAALRANEFWRVSRQFIFRAVKTVASGLAKDLQIRTIRHLSKPGRFSMMKKPRHDRTMGVFIARLQFGNGQTNELLAWT